MKEPAPSLSVIPERPSWQGYAFGLAVLVIALLARWALDPLVRGGVPLATVYVAVALTVWFAGWKPATVITTLGFFAALWWFVEPRYTFKLLGTLDAVRAGLYAVTSTIVIYLCESLRRARHQHENSEALLGRIIDTMREGFCALDREFRILSVNRSAERKLGKKRDELLQHTLWDAIPATVGTAMEGELHRALREQTRVEFETHHLAAGRWHAVTASPLGDGLALFFQDITATRTQLDQLERLVDDRTAALQRIVSDLETFSYTLVHDMRAPLRSITGFAEILAVDHAHQLDAEGKRHVARIQRSAARMDQLIIDILDYSQVSRGQPELRPTDLDAVVREILRSHADFQPDRADIEIEGQLPSVRGNPALLTQCFSNLLHNATKFVAAGVRPRVRISSRTSGDTARIEIADNGIGVAPESQARIFQPFHREHAHYDGTGIGLAIVQKVVDNLGGRVGVESQMGEGSKFWVELKTATAPAVGMTPKPPARILA